MSRNFLVARQGLKKKYAPEPQSVGTTGLGYIANPLLKLMIYIYIVVL